MNANPSRQEPAAKDEPTARATRAPAPRIAPAASGTAERRAAVILEVLAGVRTVAEAAQVLGICANHYYLLERKALAGLVAAPGPGRTLATLQGDTTCAQASATTCWRCDDPRRWPPSRRPQAGWSRPWPPP